MVKFGWHLDTATIPYENALLAMRSSGADYHLLMIDPHSFYLGSGDLLTIRKYLEALPNVKLIIRTYNTSEGAWQRYPSAIEYERHWKWIRANLGDSLTNRLVFDDPVNEPNLGGSDANLAKPYVARCVDMVKAASNAGIKFAVGAWSVGTPHENLLETVYTPLWFALHDYKQAISWHLYGAIPNEVGEIAPLEAVLDAKTARHYMSDGNWPIDHKGWLVARPYRLIEHFRQYDLGIPEIYITECFVDNIFNSQSSWIKEAWKSQYASTKYPDPRGIQAWEKYLSEMFPEMSFEDATSYLLSHARKNIFYHPAFKAGILFAMNWNWGYPNGSNKEAGSNYADGQFTRFRNELLAQVNKDEIMTIFYDATISSKASSNIRVLPSATANILRVLTTIPIEVKITKEGISAEGYTWLELKIGDERGYVAKTQNLIIEYAPIVPTEPVYEVALGYATIRMTAQQVDWTATIFEGMAFAIRNAPKVE